MQDIEKRELDIIVYGASGFTAKFVIQKLLKTNLKIACAGRSIERIKKNIEDFYNSEKNKSIKFIECTPENLHKYTGMAKLVLNLAGPYVFCGEAVVKACIGSGTHYMDISGETFFIETLISEYHEEAKNKNVYIINCCGYDSIPADIGVEHLKDLMECDHIYCESLMSLNGVYANKGTYESLIYGLKNADKLRALRRKNKSSAFATSKSKIKKLFYNQNTKSYCGVFMGTDASVVKRTQEFLKTKKVSDKAEYAAYFEIGGLFNLITFIIGFYFIYLFSKFEWGRKLLLRFPSFFSMNRVLSTGPTMKQVEKASFKIAFEGIGKRGNEIIKKKLVISGPDPAYVTTSICLVQSAIVLLKIIESENYGGAEIEKGGVLTPGSIFHGTDIVERLTAEGIKFDSVE